MPKKPLIRSKIHPYHVTARCNNREKFHCNLNFVWVIFNFYLNEIARIHGAKIHAFVLMPNHFHLLLSTPGDDLGLVMKMFMASVTKAINRESRRSGRVFGARYHWSIVTTDGYFDYVLKYVYRNPVKGGLTHVVEDYEFSSLQRVLGLSSISFPMLPPLGIESLVPQNDQNKFVSWLNQPFQKEMDNEIRLRLTKRA